MRRVFTSGADQVLAKPQKKLTVTVHVALPAPTHGYMDVDPSDVEIKALFSRIAREHGADIKAEDAGSAVIVTIKATTRANAKAVTKELRRQLLYRPGEESVWRAHLVVHPPEAGRAGFTAVLKPMEGTTGRRVTVGPSRDTADSNEADLARDQYNNDLARALNYVAAILQRNPAEMQMRVRFGTLILDEWRKNKINYTFAETTSLLRRAGARGTAHMLYLLSQKTINALQARLVLSNTALPDSVREYLDDGIKPTHSLIVKTKNLTVESLVESIEAQAKFGQKAGAKQHKLGALEAILQEKQYRAAEIVTVCPESGCDWAFEIRAVAAKDGQRGLPFTVEELQKSLSRFTEASRDGFPDANINSTFRNRYDIQNVYVKATWRYELGMTYVLEITMYYEVDVKPGQKAMAPTGSVVLYNSDWDHDMGPGESPRGWNPSFATQFLQPVDPDEVVPIGNPDQTAGPFSFLRRWVDWIRHALDSAMDEDASDEMSKAVDDI
ncbi:hypothetical protein VTI74DRAFT_3631 [Chaetomium olivicolor]